MKKTNFDRNTCACFVHASRGLRHNADGNHASPLHSCANHSHSHNSDRCSANSRHSNGDWLLFHGYAGGPYSDVDRSKRNRHEGF